jgi:beta-barrel assembly-enhancing protease
MMIKRCRPAVLSSLGVLALAAATPAWAQTCATPAAGSLPKTAKVPKKDRGKSPIDVAPRIAVIAAQSICDRNARLAGATATQGAVLGLGAQVLNTQAGRLDLVALPAVEAELQKHIGGFRKAWPYAVPVRPTRILFRSSDAYDAYALADNTIVVSLGVLELAESDSEILFVLAHEYAHILNGHHAVVSTGGIGKELAGGLGAVYAAGSFVTSLRANSGGVTGVNRTNLDNAVRKASAVTEALRFAFDDLFAPNYTREQEYEADAVAVDLLIGSNTTIDSYANVFARLQKLFEKRDVSRAKVEKRATSLEKTLAETMKQISSPAFLGSVGVGSAKGIASFAGNALLSVGTAAVAGGGGSKVPKDTHPAPQERRQALAAYFQAGYPTADPPIDAGVSAGRIKSLPEFKRAIAMRNTYLQAREAYANENFSGSLASLRTIGAGARTAPTFVNFMAALAARDLGNLTQAKQFYEAGRTGTGLPNVQLYESYTEAEIAQRDFPLSRNILGEARTKFRDPDHFRGLEIALLAAEGQDGPAKQAYQQCKLIKDRDYVQGRCKAAYPQGEQGKSDSSGVKLPGIPKLPF